MKKENIVINIDPIKQPHSQSRIQNNTIIKIWCVHLTEYLICCKKLHEKYPRIQNILFVGIQTLLHIFSLLYYKTTNLEEYYTQTQRAYLLYLEYVEHVYLKNTIYDNTISPSVFVYNRIFELITFSNEELIDDCNIFTQIAFWTNFILLRKYSEISFDERHKFVQDFLQDYLFFFSQSSKHNIEKTMEMFNDQMYLQKENHQFKWREIFSEILHFAKTNGSIIFRNNFTKKEFKTKLENQNIRQFIQSVFL